MTATVIRHADHEEVPWRNGLGVTREVANAYRADGSLIWRISLATVDRDGAFSPFADCKRILMLLTGPGMVLDFGDHGAVEVRRPFAPVTFEGGWPTSAKDVTAANTVFNVVTARPHADGRTAVIAVGEDGLALGTGGTLRLFHVLSGGLRAEVGDANLTINAGETLRLDTPTMKGEATPMAEGTLVYRVDIDLASNVGTG